MFLIIFLLYVTTDDQKKTAHLLALDGANERLCLFEANLMEEGSFDSVVDGCEGVFHTASPVTFSVTDPQVHPLNFYCFVIVLVRLPYHDRDITCLNHEHSLFMCRIHKSSHC